MEKKPNSSLFKINAVIHVSLSLGESHMTLEWHRNCRNNSLQKENHIFNGTRHPLPLSTPQRLSQTLPFCWEGTIQHGIFGISGPRVQYRGQSMFDPLSEIDSAFSPWPIAQDVSTSARKDELRLMSGRWCLTKVHVILNSWHWRGSQERPKSV